MELSNEDRLALQNVWMSQKAKMQLTQMEMSRRLGFTQIEFADIMKGKNPLSLQFVQNFCQHLHVDPYTFLPSLIALRKENKEPVIITTTVSVQGQVQNVRVEDNQVIIQYQYINN
ncbi:helix-turn-helix transcriptional regulator [Vibrio sp.]|uniref:XRE family transcriptional regulator n=1 Tax=Vibrio viridaestus TaxID=2487322 RepID=A0A3N9U589_9VIBR|nr:helix-turn-helix transcriptional regulator [Vibrio viridaestus]MDC0611869.1 helix-turn-helix transcriptional regulator [Vibrio sp.]RQW64862.1 XRE family transcriptional regulator [Vibrio viridaestus]